jgi:hypothetical protein
MTAKEKKQKRRVGRPRLPVDKAKSESLRFRLTPVEKQRLLELAESQGTSYALLARSFVMEKLNEAGQAA